MSFDYEANGALDKQTLGSGVIINNTYDPLTNRLTSLFAARPAYLALLDVDYTYDDGGNITVIEDEVRDEAWSYEYDALDRLTYAGLSDVNGLLLERQSFTYDTLGNILTTSRR